MTAVRESILFGNEIYYDYQCTLCENEGRNKEASRYCQDCCVFMCEQCTKSHETLPSNVAHKLVDDRQFEVIEQPFVVWCTRHPGGLIKIYCEKHDTLCCTLCKVLDHSDCDRLLHLSEAIESTTDFIDDFISDIEIVLNGRKADRSRVEIEAHEAERSIKDVRSRLNNYFDLLEKKSLDELEIKRSALVEKITSDIEQLESTKNKTRGEMEEFRSVSKLNEPVVFLQIKECKKRIADTRGKVEDISQSLNTEILQFQIHSQIDDYLGSLDEIGSFVEVYDTFSSDGEVNTFQTNKLTSSQSIKSSTLDEHKLCVASRPSTASDSLPCGAYLCIDVSDSEDSSRTNPDSAKETGACETLSFPKEQAVAKMKEPVYDVLPCHRDRNNIVETANVENFEKYEISQITGFNVRESSDQSTCNIFDICQSLDGTILLTDNGNKKLKRIDHGYKLRDSLRLPGDPYCVCAAGPDQAVVSLRNQKKIQFIHVGKKLSLAKAFPVGDCCRGIAYVDGNLNVCVGQIDGNLTGRIEVYNYNGELQYYIPQAPQRLNTVLKYLVLCEVGKCRYVTMYGRDSVAALDITGNFTDSIACDLLEQPEGLCTDGKGQIFVCGFHNDKIVQISPKHKKVEIILDEKHGIKKPIAVHYMHDGVNKLLVSCANLDAVLIFELKECLPRPQSLSL